VKLSDVYLIVRKPEHRHGKGRFWKEGSRGYTDDVMEAGVFTAQEAKDNTEEPSYARAIPLREILADCRECVRRLHGGELVPL